MRGEATSGQARETWEASRVSSLSEARPQQSASAGRGAGGGDLLCSHSEQCCLPWSPMAGSCGCHLQAASQWHPPGTCFCSRLFTDEGITPLALGCSRQQRPWAGGQGGVRAGPGQRSPFLARCSPSLASFPPAHTTQIRSLKPRAQVVNHTKSKGQIRPVSWSRSAYIRGVWRWPSRGSTGGPASRPSCWPREGRHPQTQVQKPYGSNTSRRWV